MKKVILIVILLISFLSISQGSYARDKNSPGRAKKKTQKIEEDKWLGVDKFGHFFISGFIAGSSYSIYHQSFNNDRESSIYFASILTLSLGVGKELSDSKKPKDKFSYKDIIFDILGISAGILVASH